jgi:hypothetical protein
MDRAYGSWDHGWLLLHGGLMTMGRRDRFQAQEVIMIVQRERERERERGGEGGRERRSLGFSPMAPLRGRVVEMGTRQRLTKAVDGALMGRWFQV